MRGRSTKAKAPRGTDPAASTSHAAAPGAPTVDGLDVGGGDVGHDVSSEVDLVPDSPVEPAPAGLRSLASKVDHLFKTVHPASGEYSFGHVSRATQAGGGPGISVATLWALRAGTRDNPTMRNLQALADFFGVPAQYFFDDEVASRIDEQLALVTALRDAPVRAMAMRASGLSPESLATITDMIERVRKLEGLPDDALPASGIAAEDPPST